MRIVAMTNAAQLPMMKNMLNSALKSGWDMSKFHCYILNDQPAAASYNTSEFQSITTTKLKVIHGNMMLDREVIWIDNDIVLFENTIEDMRRYPGNFVMQDDIWSPCTGFFLARSGVFSTNAILRSISWLKSQKNTSLNDQHAFADVSSRSIGLIVTRLPQEEYPNGQIYFNQKKTSKAKMVHCNYLATTAEKVARFKEHNLWDESDTAFELVTKYYI